MADFSALKTAIQANIRTNGNEEITGAILQDILLSMVTMMGDGAINSLAEALAAEVTARQNAVGAEKQERQQEDSSLSGRINAEAQARAEADTQLGNSITAITTRLNEGYIYAGIATPSTNPGTPAGKVFYIALQAGTYTNFSSLTVTQGINILKCNGTAWSQEQLVAIDDVPTAGSNNLVKSGGILSETQKHGLPICSWSNAFNPNYTRSGKAINSDGSIMDFTGGNYIMTWYYMIPDDCVKILFNIPTRGGGLRFRICSEPNDSSLGAAVNIQSNTEYLPIYKSQYPYICFGVYRDADTSVVPDLSNVSITFVSQKMLDDKLSESQVDYIEGKIDVEWESSTFIRPTGEVVHGGTYNASGYIKVNGGEFYNVGICGSASTVGVSFYTEQSQSSILTDFNILNNDYFRRLNVAIPFGAAYMRLVCSFGTDSAGYNVTAVDTVIYKLKKDAINLMLLNKQSQLDIEETGVKNLFDITNLRTGKSIASFSPYNIIDYTANRYIITDYIDVVGYDKIIYSGIPTNGNVFYARFTKEKTDTTTADNVRVIQMNYVGTGGISSGELNIASISSVYRYMTIAVCRVDANVVVDLSNVNVIGVKLTNTEEKVGYLLGNSYSSNIFRFNAIAPKRACLTIEMDINGNSINSDTTIDFINICKSAGFAPSMFPMDTQATNTNLVKWKNMGCDISIHTDPADGIGRYNTAPHPTTSEFPAIVDEYIANFVGNGLYPIGWVTSQGEMVAELVPLLTSYVGYAHTKGNGDWRTDTPANFVNNQNTSKLEVLRWGIEQDNTDPSERDQDCIDAAKSVIDAAISSNGLVVLYCHSYNLYDGTTYTTRATVLSAIIEYIKQKVNAGKLIVGSAAEICNYYFG